MKAPISSSWHDNNFFYSLVLSGLVFVAVGWGWGDTIQYFRPSLSTLGLTDSLVVAIEACSFGLYPEVFWLISCCTF